MTGLSGTPPAGSKVTYDLRFRAPGAPRLIPPPGENPCLDGVQPPNGSGGVDESGGAWT